MPFDRAHLPDPTTYFENQGLILKGPRSAKWKTTTCNFHGGSDSLRINVASGAWVCMSCGEKGGDVLAYEMKDGGKEFVEAAKALGCWIDDGRQTWRDVALAYVVAVYKSGQYATTKDFYKALHSKAGTADSPFQKGTGANSGSLFVQAISKPLSLKAMENAMQEIRHAAK